MQGKIVVDKQHRIVLLRCSGEMTVQSIITLINFGFSQPDYEPGLGCVIDLRKTVYKGTFTELAEVAKFIANRFKGPFGKVAIMVENPEIAAMSAIYSDCASKIHQAEIFVSLSAMARFMDVPRNILDQLNKSGAVDFKN